MLIIPDGNRLTIRSGIKYPNEATIPMSASTGTSQERRDFGGASQ